MENPIKPEQKKEIPLSWFYGIGDKERGIIFVEFSAEILNLEPEKIQTVTGFSREELEAEKERLLNKYKGQKEAPFKFKLSKTIG
jgi:hypothetical protein